MPAAAPRRAETKPARLDRDRQARCPAARRHRHLRRPRLLQRPGGRRRPRRRRRRRYGLPLFPQQGRPPHLDLRTHHEGGDRRRTAERRRLDRPGRAPPARSRGSTSDGWDETGHSPSSFRSSSGSRRSSWSGSPRPTCANTSASSATSSPTARSRACSARPSARRSPPSSSSAPSTRWRPTGS